MTARPRISVIVRALDEAASIGRCLDLVASQRTAADLVEVIVVDSGSLDRTVEIAREHDSRILTIGRSEFTFGRALNRGAEAAGGEILVALSAHAFPPDDGWLGRLAAAFDDPRVACASGERFRPDGRALGEAFPFDADAARAWPEWGYSNAAGAFRASLWRERPFREDLPACEDREWCRHWVLERAERGYVCVLDPVLLVDHDHTHDPVLAIYRRARREAAGFAMFLPPGAGEGEGVGALRRLAAEWWADTRFYDNPWRARFSHRRAARLLGASAGARSTPRVESDADSAYKSTRP
jgi:rhamnosyltransferase